MKNKKGEIWGKSEFCISSNLHRKQWKVTNQTPYLCYAVTTLSLEEEL